MTDLAQRGKALLHGSSKVVLGVIGRAVTVAALAEHLQIQENEVEE